MLLGTINDAIRVYQMLLGTLKCHKSNLGDIKVIYPSLELIKIQKFHDYDHLGATMINQDPKVLSHES